MKKNRVHILTAIFSVMLIALFSLSANAYISLDEDDLTKTVNNVKYHMFESEGEKRAIAYEFVADEEITELNILSEVDGYKVTSVEATSFFKSFPKVTEITIGENVESLSFHTFASFESLKKVNLPSTLTSIGDEVFAGCSSLESMNLEYVTYIGTEAFQNCTALKEVTFSENLKTIGSRSFRNTGFETITIPSKAYLSGTESFAVVGEQFRDCAW